MKKVAPGLKVPDPPVPNRAHTEMSVKVENDTKKQNNTKKSEKNSS